MRTIILKRQKNFTQSAMLYQIKCDGNVVATLKNGQEKNIELDEEKHSIQCFADTIALDAYESSNRFYSDLMDIPAGNQNILVSVKPGFASIKMSIEGADGIQVGSTSQQAKGKKKFSIGIFLLLTLLTGIGGIIYAVFKLAQKD